jgi:hypothetical protein
VLLFVRQLRAGASTQVRVDQSELRSQRLVQSRRRAVASVVVLEPGEEPVQRPLGTQGIAVLLRVLDVLRNRLHAHSPRQRLDWDWALRTPQAIAVLQDASDRL